MMGQLSLPALTGLAQGVSDAGAGFLVAQVLLLNSLPTIDYILLYNALVFRLQPVAGLLLDIFNMPRRRNWIVALGSFFDLDLVQFKVGDSGRRVGFHYLPYRWRFYRRSDISNHYQVSPLSYGNP